MINSSKGSRGAKSEQKKVYEYAQMNKMLAYCNERVQCRRQMILKYLLGESPFNAELDCRKTCDNCQKERYFKEEDMTTHAKLILKCMLNANNAQFGKKNITQNQLVNLLKYEESKTARAGTHRMYDPLQGHLKRYELPQVEEFVRQLIFRDFIFERPEKVSYFQGANSWGKNKQ
jgi:superfamily II DNA helicase RecQ